MRNIELRKIAVVFLLMGMVGVFTHCEKGSLDTTLEDISAVPINNRETALTTDMCNCIETNYPIEALSQEEKTEILFMREEEKLARDVYLGLYDQWESMIFSNIAKAEQQHMNAILCLINKYDLIDPATDNPAGIFENDTLQNVYNELMTKGQISLTGALSVGATIEDLDIADLMEMSRNVDNEDVLAVFGELTKGSRNHMRAFNRRLTSFGLSYEAKYISQDLFTEIINSATETGGGAYCGSCNNPQ